MWKIVTFPDLVCICGLDELAEDANKLLMLSNTFQLLSYDTTFQLGDFHVSPLIVRYSIFDQKACVPLAFMIHECKFSSTHQEMLRECTRKIPSLRNLHCPIVVDKEKAIINAIRTELPDVPLYSAGTTYLEMFVFGATNTAHHLQIYPCILQI